MTDSLASVHGPPNFMHPLHCRGRMLSVKGPHCCGMARDEDFAAHAADEVLLVGEGHAVFLMSFGPKLV